MKFKIKVNQIKEFVDFLMSLELRGSQSRLRTRFAKLLDKKAAEIQEEFMEHILKQYCHLDEEGKPKTKEINGINYWDIKEECREDFNKDHNELYSEEYVVEGEEHRDTLLTVKDVVLNCDKKFSGREALKFDEWCELVEAIEEE